jgi:hypothetical protein
VWHKPLCAHLKTQQKTAQTQKETHPKPLQCVCNTPATTHTKNKKTKEETLQQQVLRSCNVYSVVYLFSLEVEAMERLLFKVGFCFAH